MDWGLANRWHRLFGSDGRSVMLAVDHGYFLGPISKLEQPAKTLEPLLPYADAIALTRGVLRTSVPPAVGKGIILRVSGGASVLQEDLSDETLATSMEEAVRLNVSAVAMSLFIGAPHEHQSIANLAKLVDEAEARGIPVLGITAVGKELDKRDARYLALACRIAAEFGARLVKTYYCEGFEKVVDSCPVPLVVAGGPKLNTELDVLNLVEGAIGAGAAGVDMGRNIWQNDAPVAMIRAVRGIVHEGRTAKEAHQLYQEIRAGKV
ncbi:MAG TPA: 3-hydroxy-5-phosphonooxypentane-2,4-dione thiolase [Candidatus Thermoplasmatota archaeon]|nr:3-hydroxy-5-phosphonooxypentane-2,4-dione thiolase [Candidatus Thermoplasmatota archaeon]